MFKKQTWIKPDDLFGAILFYFFLEISLHLKKNRPLFSSIVWKNAAVQFRR